MTSFLRLLVLLALVCSFGAGAAIQKTPHSAVELIAEQSSLPADGGTVMLGFYLDPDPTWHAYWSNPGDAGKGPHIEWTLSDGFEIGELQFPTPHLLPFGDLNTYGFEDAELFMAEMAVPAGQTAGDEVRIEGKARWVVCDDKVCVPEQAVVALTLAVGDAGVDESSAPRFARARERLPRPVEWPAEFYVGNDKVRFVIEPGTAIESLEGAYLFVESKRLIRYGSQSSGFTTNGLEITMDAAAQADVEKSTNAVLTFTDRDGETGSVILNLTRGSGVAGTISTGGLGLISALAFAFLGGIILNLMPCVFPILSIKALSLVNMGQSDRHSARDSGVMYTLGILVMFAAIGGALLALRSGGEAIGWGFQLQSTGFLIALTLLMVAIGLNLFGVFEFGTRVMGVGQGLTEGGERKSAFFTGLLAVIVATPCTAPFMAGALGYALAQPTAVSMSIFLVMGLGLAFPYLLLSFVPAFGRMMPKPGAWMETLRHVLAFPMFLVAIWLLWVIGGQLGSDAVAAVLVAVLLMSFALWAYGRGMTASRKLRWHAVAVLGTIACAYVAFNVESHKAVADDGISAGTLGDLELEHFDPDRLQGYIAGGQPAFVYFTADWCVSCKVNERVALATDAVAEAFNTKGIKVIEGDWTAEDPVITEWLQRYDRIGVPLYLYFPRGSSLETAIVLPQILTPGLIVDAVGAADEAAEELMAEISRAAGSGESDESADEIEEYINFEVPVAEPDWVPVQAYIDVDTRWHELDREIRDSDDTLEEKDRRRAEERGPHPEVLDAMAAATAIARLEGAHDKKLDAARFLIEEIQGAPGSVPSMLLGLKILGEQEGQFTEWRGALFRLDFAAPVGWFPEVDEFFDDYEGFVPDDPAVLATARYYAASRQLRFANAVSTPAEARPEHRQRGVEFATGLSAGVEDEELIKRRRFTDEGEPIPFQTLAAAEEDLLYNLNFLTVGNKIPNVEGVRLDGAVESVEDFEGQAVLLDFWATWCAPCIASIPKLVELDEGLPEDEFEILSISVDEQIESVTEFQVSRPMNWANWHVGPKADLLQTWAVRGYPTYVLIDHNGLIVARQHDLNKDFISLIKDTACKRAPSGSC